MLRGLGSHRSGAALLGSVVFCGELATDDGDVSTQDLAVRTKTLAERAAEIQNTGLTGPYEKFFSNLEGKLAQAQSIVNARNATAAAVTVLMELIEELRYQWGNCAHCLIGSICSSLCAGDSLN